MSVYFIREQPEELIKIGVAIEPPRRLRDLQTGNSRKLELLGWIEVNRQTSFRLERELHAKYASESISGEWFTITTGVVLDELRRAGIHGFVPKNADAFEILGRDRDGMPEFVGVCVWVSLELDECCPFCGCMCGMHEVDDTGMYFCRHCDTLTCFDDLPG